MDLKVPIRICDELADSIINSTGQLDLASGEIRGVQYDDYDPKVQGLPGQREDYEFTSGLLSNNGKDVEFRVEVDSFTGNYSITPSELLELKVRAAKLFAGIAPITLVAVAPVSNEVSEPAAGSSPTADRASFSGAAGSPAGSTDSAASTAPRRQSEASAKPLGSADPRHKLH